jgi:hypothetical protein
MGSQLGTGTKLFKGPLGASPVFVELLGIQDVAFPEISAADVKDTNYQTAGQFHDYAPGWSEGGTIDVVKDFISADEIALRGLYRTRLQWKVQLSSLENWVFTGYINKMGGALPAEDKISIKFSIKICTAPVMSLT